MAWTAAQPPVAACVCPTPVIAPPVMTSVTPAAQAAPIVLPSTWSQQHWPSVHPAVFHAPAQAPWPFPERTETADATPGNVLIEIVSLRGGAGLRGWIGWKH